MSAPSAARLSVLLVHANPFQQLTPVPPYGLERIRTAAEATGAVIEILDPYLVSDRPIAAAVEATRRLEPDVVGLGIRVVEDCVVIDRLDVPEADGSPFDLTWFMPELRRLRRALGEAAPAALFLLGGAAFSAMPGECLDYLEVEYGVVGAGEPAFAEILDRVAAAQPLEGVAGLVRRGQPEPLQAYALAAGGPTRREPLHAPINSIPVRTRIGCTMECVYCLTANTLRRHLSADVEGVLGEIEAALGEASERGIGHVPFFFTDDEFNLPDERHPVAVLREIQARGLAKRLRWRAYFNPTPFSAELAALIASTNGHASITVDSAAEAVITRTQKPFRPRHLDELVETLRRERVPADLALIFGLPGETEETIAETVAFVRSLPVTIEVVYSVGARVYPHTPLAGIAASEPERLVGADDPSFFEPVVYSSPLPPRELARRLADAFAGLENVRRVGVGFGSGRRTIPDAYRAVLRRAGPEVWRGVLDQAERPGDYQRSPVESLGAVAQLAIWHGRFDLAAAAYKRLASQPELPDEVSRNQLRLARLGCSALATLDRLKGIRGAGAAASSARAAAN